MHYQPPPLRVTKEPPTAGQPRCSFCGRSADQVEVLVSGMDGAQICDNCAELVVELCDEEKAGRPGRTRGAGS